MASFNLTEFESLGSFDFHASETQMRLHDTVEERDTWRRLVGQCMLDEHNGLDVLASASWDRVKKYFYESSRVL